MSSVIDRPISGPMVWLGQDLARSSDCWIRPLSATAIEEIDAAFREVTRRGLGWREVRKKDFPLPGCSAGLAQVNRDLEWGRGLVLLRGLPVERYTDEELRLIWWGIGTHLGTAVYQNAHGELIGEVRDEVRLYGEVIQPAVPTSKGFTSRAKARSSGPLRWHTDRCDVVGLFCVRAARQGGISRVVSVPAVSNAIRAGPTCSRSCTPITTGAVRARRSAVRTRTMRSRSSPCTRAASRRSTRAPSWN